VELQGKSVLLTGASGPTGQVIARELHSKGANLKVSARNVEALERLKGDLGGERVEVLAGNLETPEDARALAERAGDLDVLVSFAGISPVGPIEEHPTDEVERVIDVNLHAPIHLAQAVLPGMKERGRGHLVFFSSISGKSPSKGRSLYSAACYGVRGFANCLHLDLHGTGVDVTTIMPGPIVTPGDDEKPGFSLDIPPERVAKAVVRGIERNKREITVAPAVMKTFLAIGNLAPGLLLRTGPEPD